MAQLLTVGGMDRRFEYRDGRLLASWAIPCLTVAVVTKFSAALVACMRLKALANVDAEEVCIADFTPDGIVAMIASADGFAWILAQVFFYMWLFRAAINARALGSKGLSQSPCWSFINFLIPVWRLVMPYFFLRELWSVSVADNPGDPAAWKGSKPPWRVTAYFLVWLVAYVASVLIADLVGYIGIEKIVMPLLDNPSPESVESLANGIVPTVYAKLQGLAMAFVSGFQVLTLLFLRSYARVVTALQTCRAESRRSCDPPEKEGFGWPE